MDMSTVVARLKYKTGGVIFLLQSAGLTKCFNEPIYPEDYTGLIINKFRNELLLMEFVFMLVPGEKLAVAKWQAEQCRTSKQHSVLGNEKGPWPPRLAELLA